MALMCLAGAFSLNRPLLASVLGRVILGVLGLVLRLILGLILRLVLRLIFLIVLGHGTHLLTQEKHCTA